MLGGLTGEERVERGKGSGGLWKVRKGLCPSPGTAAVFGLPWLLPGGGTRGADLWAETATFWEATGGSTGHGAPRAPAVGKLTRGWESPPPPPPSSPRRVYCRTYGSAAASQQGSLVGCCRNPCGETEAGRPHSSPSPPSQPLAGAGSTVWVKIRQNPAKHTSTPPRNTPNSHV